MKFFVAENKLETTHTNANVVLKPPVYVNHSYHPYYHSKYSDFLYTSSGSSPFTQIFMVDTHHLMSSYDMVSLHSFTSL